MRAQQLVVCIGTIGTMRPSAAALSGLSALNQSVASFAYCIIIWARAIYNHIGACNFTTLFNNMKHVCCRNWMHFDAFYMAQHSQMHLYCTKQINVSKRIVPNMTSIKWWLCKRVECVSLKRLGSDYLSLSQLQGQVLNLSLIVANKSARIKMQPIYWTTQNPPSHNFVIC